MKFIHVPTLQDAGKSHTILVISTEMAKIGTYKIEILAATEKGPCLAVNG
jgi:hypothetical protein